MTEQSKSFALNETRPSRCDANIMTEAKPRAKKTSKLGSFESKTSNQVQMTTADSDSASAATSSEKKQNQFNHRKFSETPQKNTSSVFSEACRQLERLAPENTVDRGHCMFGNGLAGVSQLSLAQNEREKQPKTDREISFDFSTSQKVKLDMK